MKDGLSNYTIAEVGQWPDLFWECSQLALKQAQWMRRPQVRVLQTISLYLYYLDFTNEGPDALIWIGAAAKAAHVSLSYWNSTYPAHQTNVLCSFSASTD